MSETAPGQQRLRSLDGLRGVAAIVVVLHHLLLTRSVYSHAFLQGEVHEWRWYIYSPLHVLTAGTEAVVVFFVLSGLVLSLPVLNQPNFSYAAYYPARIVRLYLPVVVSVALAGLIALATPFSDAQSSSSLWLRLHAHVVNLHAIVADVTLLDGASFLNSPLWSLRWEVYFSLLLPIYIWLAVKFARIAPLLLGLSLLLVSALSASPVYATVYLVQFAAGVLLATSLGRLTAVVARINASRFGALTWLGGGIVSVLCLSSGWTVGHSMAAEWVKLVPTLVLTGAVLLVVMAIGCPSFRAFLTGRPAQWLGKISFSLYLVHEPLIVALSVRLPAHLQWLLFPLGIVLSLVLAEVFFRLVEAPAHSISKNIRRRLKVGNGRHQEGRRRVLL